VTEPEPITTPEIPQTPRLNDEPTVDVVVVSHEHHEDAGIYKVVFAERRTETYLVGEDEEVSETFGPPHDVIFADSDVRWLDADGNRRSDEDIATEQLAEVRAALESQTRSARREAQQDSSVRPMPTVGTRLL
jgi:hypothetical protein